MTAKPRKLTRGDRWLAAADSAVIALQELLDIQSEYQAWYDNMPESLQGGTTGEKLSAICELDIGSAQDTAQEAVDADLPLGFGRD